MLLAHAVAVAEARTHLAALADLAASPQAALAYERALLYLDGIHEAHLPALHPTGPIGQRAARYDMAEAAVEDLLEHGEDALQVELLLAMLHEAHHLDPPA